MTKANPKTTFAYFSLAVLLITCTVAGYLVINKPTEQPKTLALVEPKLEPIDLKIKGNRSSKIYHLKNCPNYNDISDRNVIWFKTKEEAEGSGYRIAKNC